MSVTVVVAVTVVVIVIFLPTYRLYTRDREGTSPLLSSWYHFAMIKKVVRKLSLTNKKITCNSCIALLKLTC